MFDFVFDWRDDLSVEIDSIDEQHKGLFKIGRDMEQLLQRQCIGVTDKQLLDIVCALRDYVAYHFYEEERMMEKAGYSNLSAHRKTHNDFVNYISNIDCPKLKSNPFTELKNIKEHVTDFIFEHMLREDVTMGKELKERYEYLKDLFEEGEK